MTLNLRSRLTTRIALYILVLQIVSFVALFALTFKVATDFIETKDRQLLQAKVEEFESILSEQGVAAFKTRMHAETGSTRSHEFFIRLYSTTSAEDFVQFPDDLDDFDRPSLLADLRALGPTKQAFDYHSKTSWDDRFFGYSKTLNSGWTLQVGKSVEDWERFTQHLLSAFLKALVPFALFGLIGGLYIARKSLRPLRTMIATMEVVGTGVSPKRVSLSHNDHEFASLVVVFNKMLDRIESLISGMQDSLDAVAHDIRTPLTRLRSRAEIALRGTPDLQEYRSALEECIENANELSEFATTVMDISEAESGAMRIHLTEFNSQELLFEAVDLYEHVADDKHILLEIGNASETFVVTADRPRIKQAVTNLIDNAIKYSAADSNIEITARQTTQAFEFAVEDHGQGIDSSDLPQIWNKLYRADKSRSLPGVGLGLSTVAAIAKAHGGSATVISQPGSGSTFTISIPKV